MPDEIELKFQVPATALDAVRRLKWIVPSGPVKRQKLRSVYFDTPNRKLRAAEMFLRVRHIGKSRVQTLKADGHVARQEWECEIDSSEPDLSRFKKAGIGRIKKSDLRPIFETVVTRTAIPLEMADSVIELALDHGEIKAGGKREPLSEIELEVKQGDRAAMIELAERLTRKVPARYAVRAKPERGFALKDGASDCESHARDLVLKPKTPVADAFRAIGLECLRQIVANEAAVLAARSEGVHQMRVGLRRLRAALSLFKPLLGDRQSQSLKGEFKWLTEQLGPARDFDVFVHESVEPLETSAEEMTLLRREMEEKRDAGFERARAAVKGERYRKLVLNTLFWLLQGDWVKRPATKKLRERCAAAFAAELLERRTAKILRRAKKLGRLDPRKRHKLRIAVKKLRYATEFFASLFKGAKKKAALGERLENLQDALGRLNDFTVHRKMAHEIVAKKRSRQPQKAFAIGLVTGQEQANTDACLTAARKSAAHLKAQKPFW